MKIFFPPLFFFPFFFPLSRMFTGRAKIHGIVQAFFFSATLFFPPSFFFFFFPHAIPGYSFFV